MRSSTVNFLAELLPAASCRRLRVLGTSVLGSVNSVGD